MSLTVARTGIEVRRALPKLLGQLKADARFTLADVRPHMADMADCKNVSSVLVELEKIGVLIGDHSGVPTVYKFNPRILKEVLRCPLCAGDAKLEYTDFDNGPEWTVVCECGLLLRDPYVVQAEEVIVLRWNLRC